MGTSEEMDISPHWKHLYSPACSIMFTRQGDGYVVVFMTFGICNVTRTYDSLNLQDRRISVMKSLIPCSIAQGIFGVVVHDPAAHMETTFGSNVCSSIVYCQEGLFVMVRKCCGPS